MGPIDEEIMLHVCLGRRNSDISGRLSLAVLGKVVVSMLGVWIDRAETLVVLEGELPRVSQGYPHLLCHLGPGSAAVMGLRVLY